MKITNFIIIFITIVFPGFFYLEYRAMNTQTFAEINHHHKGALIVAAHDAAQTLRNHIQPQFEVNYESQKIDLVDPQPSFEAFLQTLALNYGVIDNVTMDRLARYVPVFAVLDYDGLLINVYKEFQNDRQENVMERVWLPKIPFSYVDGEGNMINFSVADEVEVYDAELKEWIEGKRTELLTDAEITVPLLSDATEFDQIRRSIIVNTLQEQFAYYINEHNVYTKKLDVTYKFALPLIPQEDWYNTVDDISIFAFFQGYPYQMDTSTFHEYAFVGTRIREEKPIQAGIVNGERRFWYESCNFSHSPREMYATKKQAAQAGYRELACLNP